MSKRNREPFFKKTPVIRFQVEVLKVRLPMLEQLCSKTGIRTKRELWDNAIALLEWTVQETLNGNTVGSRGSDGGFREICMPVLSTTKALSATTREEPS